MTGWSRQRQDSKLSAWAKSQDLSLVERELERAKKDLIRATNNVTLKPEYILKRQQERARARDATNRLSSIGLNFDLGPFLFDIPLNPNLNITNSKNNDLQKQLKQQQINHNVQSHHEIEILNLKNQLIKLNEKQIQLEFDLSNSENKRFEERKLFDRDRKLMLCAISKLKLELNHSWNYINKLKKRYQGAIQFEIESESGGGSASKIYETDESFEKIYRSNSVRPSPSSSGIKADPSRSNQPTRPSSSASTTHSLNKPIHSNPNKSGNLNSATNPSHLNNSINPSSAASSRTRRTSIG